MGSNPRSVDNSGYPPGKVNDVSELAANWRCARQRYDLSWRGLHTLTATGARKAVSKAGSGHDTVIEIIVAKMLELLFIITDMYYKMLEMMVNDLSFAL